MLEIDEKLRDLYRKDTIPVSRKVAYKRLKVCIPELNLEIEKEKIVGESMQLTESICSDTDIMFGGCEAAQMKFTVADTEEELEGKICVLSQIVEEKYEMPLGTYVIDSVKREDDLRFRSITAYDLIYSKLDTDVTEWYQSLAFPLKLKVLRKSLFAYVGIELEEQELVNDEIMVEKTINPKALNGRTVARAIGEINGAFGHMTRENRFKYIRLSGFGLYPSEDLYPSEELYPAGPAEKLGRTGYISTVYEDYMAEGIDCLQIRQEEGDVGSVVYDTRNYKNPYIVTGNFLVYGKNARELEEVGRNLFDEIKNKPYRPHTTTMAGLPYLEVGDTVTVEKEGELLEAFIFSRKLTGVQALRDEISATGNQYRENEVSPNDEIEMLKGKSLIIQKNVDGLSTKVTDLENNTNSRFEQTANQITLQVSDLDEKLSGQIKLTKESLGSRMDNVELGLNSKIEQTANSIRTEVNNSVLGLNSKIEQTESRISQRVSGLEGDYSSLELYVDRIESTVSDMEGNVSKLEQTVDGFTFSSSGGAVKIHGDTIESGTLKSVSVVFDTHNAVYWVAGGSDIGDTTETEWGCSSDAIFGNYRGERTIQLYRRSGDVRAEGTGYFDEIYITGSQSFWQGWSLSDTLEDLYNRVKALERG